MKKTSMIAAVLLLVACGSASHLTPPANFLALDENEEGYAQRATSAEGVVIATRELDNDHEGTLAFWVEAIKQRMQLLPVIVRFALKIEGRKESFGQVLVRHPQLMTISAQLHIHWHLTPNKTMLR